MMKPITYSSVQLWFSKVSNFAQLDQLTKNKIEYLYTNTFIPNQICYS